MGDELLSSKIKFWTTFGSIYFYSRILTCAKIYRKIVWTVQTHKTLSIWVWTIRTICPKFGRKFLWNFQRSYQAATIETIFIIFVFWQTMLLITIFGWLSLAFSDKDSLILRWSLIPNLNPSGDSNFFRQILVKSIGRCWGLNQWPDS